MNEKVEEDFVYPSAVTHIDLLPPCSAHEGQLMMQAMPGYKKKECDEPKPNQFRVYMLRERTDGPCSYVGHTGKIPEARLAEHNETFEKGRGADETRGKQWKSAGYTCASAARTTPTVLRRQSMRTRWSTGHSG